MLLPAGGTKEGGDVTRTQQQCSLKRVGIPSIRALLSQCWDHGGKSLLNEVETCWGGLHE